MQLQNKKVVYIAFFIVVIVLVALYLFNQTKINPKANNNNQTTTIMMYNVKALQFNKKGKVERKVIAPKLQHDNKTATNILYLPVINVIHNNKPWKITAKLATSLNNNEKIILEDNVKINQFESGKIVSTLLTKKLFYYPKTQQVETDADITYISQGMTINSKGMTADLNNETVELTSNARGIYVPKKS